MLREHFVCIEFNPALTGGVPVDRYPGLEVLGEAWDRGPWSHVSFGLVWVVEPEGNYLLSPCTKAPVEEFQLVVEKAMQNFIRIRSHPRGSRGEAEEIERVRAEVDTAWTSHFAEGDQDLRTKQILELRRELETRLPGIFEDPDPGIRQRAIEQLGRYAQNERDPGFGPGGETAFLGEGTLACLDDENAGVRRAAAVSVFQFLGERVPDADGEALSAAARRAWEAAAEPRDAAAPLDEAREGRD